MDSMNKESSELLMQPQLLRLDYRLDVGPMVSRMFAEMKENKRIFGTVCPQCGRHGIPPRAYCGKCGGVEMTGWAEEGDEGEVLEFNVQHYEFAHSRTGVPIKTPWASAAIRLLGGGIVKHFVYPPDPKQFPKGTRVKAVWKEDRQGLFTDIRYFRKMKDDEPSQKLAGGAPMEAPAKSIPTALNVMYSKTAGTLGSRQLVELRDKAQINGVKCPKCDKIYAPGSSVCDQCFELMDELVPLSGKGTVTSYTVVRRAERLQPVSPPYALAVIQMAGADTGMVHILGEVDLAKIEIGMEVEPVFKNERTGHILDIKYFRTVGKETSEALIPYVYPTPENA